MVIKLSSTQHDNAYISISKQRDVLTINGEDFDFTQIPDGGILPKDAINSEYILSDVTRIDGEIELTVLYPYKKNTPENCFPKPIITNEDGILI